MATTTNYGWTTPDDTALVKDGASAIRTLGSSVDTTTKNLNPSTTLGDIEFRSSTSNVNTRLGIGGTGTVLTVASGVPSWATPASSAPASATASVNASEGTTNESFVDLTTAGPSVTLTTGTKVLIIVSAQMNNSSGNGRGSKMSYAVSGASTVSAADDNALLLRGAQAEQANVKMRASSVTRQTVTAGSNTFTAKYARDGDEGTSTFANRKITVIDLGS